MYSKINDTLNGKVVTLAILYVDTVTKTRKSIPLDEENTDYQEYLEWVAEGNTAEAAD
tara:strand:+ start:376 stop:549 length:174 start_codon:yes stop_codon:yes gene_type:complete